LRKQQKYRGKGGIKAVTFCGVLQSYVLEFRKFKKGERSKLLSVGAKIPFNRGKNNIAFE